MSIFLNADQSLDKPVSGVGSQGSLEFSRFSWPITLATAVNRLHSLESYPLLSPADNSFGDFHCF